MILSIIVAATDDGVIGLDNQLPWKIPEDLKYFKSTTMGKPVIMGRKTFDSIGKPLPGRPNFVLTRSKNFKVEGVQVYADLQKAIQDCSRIPQVNEAFIVGGSEIYRLAMSMVNRIYLTQIHASFKGDAFFPTMKELEKTFTVVSRKKPQEKSAIDFEFLILEKK